MGRARLGKNPANKGRCGRCALAFKQKGKPTICTFFSRSVQSVAWNCDAGPNGRIPKPKTES